MRKPVIFDLDGTPLNTTANFARSTNCASNKLGYSTHEIEKHNSMVGDGIDKLFEHVLPEGEKSKENVLRVRKEFVPYCSTHNADDSRPYPDTPELLPCLQGTGVQIAVASNKYQAATQKSIDYYFPETHFIVVLGQHEGIKVEPDPAVVFDILEVAKVTKEEMLYVGDSSVDMRTTANARVTVCGVTWGFRSRAELEEFSPQHIVDTTERIKRLIL